MPTFDMLTFELPPQPPWEGLHPLVVHFPIALLFVTPIFVLLAALLGKYGRWFGVTALMLLVMGTVGGYVSVETGDAAYHVLEDIEGDGWTVVEEHQQAAKNVQKMFVGLTVLYAVLFAVPLVVPKLNLWKYWLSANLVFLALLMLVNIQLANAAHLGGRLVHQYGARAVLGEVPAHVAPSVSEETEAELDDDDFDEWMRSLTEEESDEATDEATDEAAEEAAEEPVDPTTEEPSEEPMEEASDQPAEEAADESPEPAEQPKEPAEEPKEPAEEPEEPSDESASADDDAGGSESDDT
jgi:uncharacterized membrane protein